MTKPRKLNTAHAQQTLAGRFVALVILVLITVATALISRVSGDADDFARFYLPLFVLSSIGIVTLGGLIGINVWQAWRDARANIPGAKLTLRFLGFFSLISAMPLLLMFYLSIQILQRGIDSWFDVRVENALNDAIHLGRQVVNLLQKERLRQTEVIASQLLPTLEGSRSERELAQQLAQLRKLYTAKDLMLYDDNWQILALSEAQPSAAITQAPSQEAKLNMMQGEPYVELKTSQTDQLLILVIVPLRIDQSRTVFLQSLFAMPSEINRLTRSVEDAYDDYQQLLFVRVPLKRSLLFTLILALLLSILSATFVAFGLSRRLLAPIRDLASGTEAVARGHYSTQLPLRSNDELSTLVKSFNTMMKEIDRSQRAAQQSQQQAKNQSAYLEAVLGNISSGVITVRHQDEIQIANSAAADILMADLSLAIGTRFKTLTQRFSHLSEFVLAVQPHLSEQESQWREEIVFHSDGERRVLICQGSALPGEGMVIVFDDVTQLINAEKESAWSEVARRIAHEIKNPLTPIQLSAERLRLKYLKTLSQEEGALLDKLTHTIIQQVEAMKIMVNAFSEYARAPQAQLSALNLVQTLEEVVEMYRYNTENLRFEKSFEHPIPQVMADPAQMRQVLHNLIKNVLEIETESPLVVSLLVRMIDENDQHFVELIFHDNGPGLPEEIASHPFEPYVTTKAKGTGLGLAVVKKIIEEHGGQIQVESNEQNGTTFRIRLPAVVKQASSTMNVP